MSEAKASAFHFFETESSLSARVAHQFRRLARDLRDPYRPELHYMRGPGPKWREKHGQAPMPPAGQPTVSST
ncbi:MAG: hypothetical protein WD073_08535 [Xanthobacteraceae bacterium]